jgi:hypothetical protein
MKQGHMRKTNSITLIVALAAWTGLSARGQSALFDDLGRPIVYENTTNYQDARTSRGNLEVGDEINLFGGATTVAEFRFEYVYTGTSPAAQGILRFYAKDDAGGLKPGTVLFESAPFTLANGFHTGIVPDLNLAMPGTFIWSVQFSGITVGVDDAGLLFYNGVSTGPSAGTSTAPGSSFDDHWERNPANLSEWLLTDNSGLIDNFGARVITVPEPTTVALLIGGAAVLGLAARRRKA